MTPDELTHTGPEFRMTLYSRLAQALNYPDMELVESLMDGTFTSNLTEALDGLGLSPRKELRDLEDRYVQPGTDPGERLLELEKDYTWMCFASKPRQVYLFESVYREGKLLQESTFEIARLYYEAGLKMDERFGFPPDHIALELEFMAYLCFNEIKSVNEKNPDREQYAAGLHRQVLDDHLVSFGLKFADALERNARTHFYRVIARIISELLAAPPERGRDM